MFIALTQPIQLISPATFGSSQPYWEHVLIQCPVEAVLWGSLTLRLSGAFNEEEKRWHFQNIQVPCTHRIYVWYLWLLHEWLMFMVGKIEHTWILWGIVCMSCAMYVSKNTTISDKFNQGQSFPYNLSSICQNRLGPKCQQELSTTVDAWNPAPPGMYKTL